MKKEEWIYIGACQYAGDHFSFWAKPVQKKDGSYTMKTKAQKTSLEQLNIDAKEHGAQYYINLTKDE